MKPYDPKEIWRPLPDQWFSPTAGTPDYYNSCSKACGFKKQQPRTGNGLMGLVLFCSIEGQNGPAVSAREYISCRLDSSLKKDQLYCVKFYLLLTDFSVMECDHIGAYLSERSTLVTAKTTSRLPFEPQVSNDGKFISDMIGWTEVSGIFKANGGERYITVGNFTDDKNGGRYKPGFKPNFGSTAYYFIDDVSVIPVNNELECIPENKPATLKNIFFDTGKSVLLPASFPELDKLVAALKQNSNSIEISGHTDNSGNEKENMKLSEARARAVADYLISKGIDAKRVKYKGYGSSKPIADNATEEGKQKNRRVEFEIIK